MATLLRILSTATSAAVNAFGLPVDSLHLILFMHVNGTLQFCVIVEFRHCQYCYTYKEECVCVCVCVWMYVRSNERIFISTNDMDIVCYCEFPTLRVSHSTNVVNIIYTNKWTRYLYIESLPWIPLTHTNRALLMRVRVCAWVCRCVYVYMAEWDIPVTSLP